ncbi:MAG: NAD(P)-dependent oxidoreductase, partial [Bacteroidota bacterium]
MRADLEAMGHAVEYAPELTREEILARMKEVEILIMNSRTHVDREFLAEAPKLRLLGRAGVGMDHFDLEALAEKGVKVVNTPGANAIPVGEQMVGMLLSLLHNVVRSNDQVRQFQWLREENRGTELRGKTVGIIGYGNTGSEVGRNLSGFGCRILAYDKYKTGYAPEFVEEVELDQIMEAADVLTLHVPLTDETKGWIDADFLADFARPIWLLNLARGPIVPLAGLLEALENGNVIAAGLDV